MLMNGKIHLPIFDNKRPCTYGEGIQDSDKPDRLASIINTFQDIWKKNIPNSSTRLEIHYARESWLCWGGENTIIQKLCPSDPCSQNIELQFSGVKLSVLYYLYGGHYQAKDPHTETNGGPPPGPYGLNVGGPGA